MTTQTSAKPSRSEVQAAFLTVLPRIERHAQVQFRHVRCPGKRDDAVADVVALAWLWFVRLMNRGKDPLAFVSALASFAVRAVRSGRRVTGQERARDTLAPIAQQKHGFCVGKLPEFATLSDNPLQDALIDNTRSPVPEQVHFRIDFTAWLAGLDDRRQRIVSDMLMSERTLDLADKHKVSPARISQLRREFQLDWERFCDGSAPHSSDGSSLP